MWFGVVGAAVVVAASGSVWLLPLRDAVQVSVLMTAVLALLLARGMFSTRSSLVQKTHWRSDDARETRVALTFDDGPHPRWTPAVLDLLRRHGVHATFFVIGENVRRHPQIVARILAEGHEIGCHGDSHSWTTPLQRPSRFEGEVRRCLGSVRAAAGVTPRLFRPPIGIRAVTHRAVTVRNDLVVVGMARRGGDTRRGIDPQAFARRFCARARRGEVLVLHDGEEPRHASPRDATLAALPGVLQGLAARGLRSVTVSSLLAERPYRESPQPGWTGRSRGGRLGLSIFSLAVRLLGPRGCLAFAPLVAGWFVLRRGPAVRASVALRRRLHGRAGILSETLWAYRHFLAFGRTMIDRVALLEGTAPAPVAEVVGDGILREAAASPVGCILVSAHVGDWIAASRVRGVGAHRLTVVAAQGMGLGPHQVRRDGGAGLFGVIDVHADPAAVGADIAAALRDGGVVAMLGDRGISPHFVRLPFLGGEADFPVGPWTAAMSTGAPVVVFFMTRRPGGGHRLEFTGPIRVPRVAREARSEAVGAAAAQFVRALETAVRSHPFEWSNFYDFWAKR